jgi:hypothetical protein
MLAVADQTQSRIHLVDPVASTLVGTVSLDHPPVDLAVSPGGHWAYVLEQDAGKGYLQAVDLFGVRQGQPVSPGPALAVETGGSLVLSHSGHTLYVPYTGDMTVPTGGGVAVVDVEETACFDLFWRSLEGCPECDTANCVVLATIDHYHVGDSIEDQTDPAADPAADLQQRIARIDNRKDRRLLPSTSTLAEAIECLCEAGGGGAPGPQGPPGDPGKNGTDGIDGVGLERGLTRIKALSWTHNAASKLLPIKRQNNPDTPGTPGIVVGFTNDVNLSTAAGRIDAEHIFQVLVLSSSMAQQRELGWLCRCPVRGTVVPVKYADDNQGHVISAVEVTAGTAPGVAFLFDSGVAVQIARQQGPTGRNLEEQFDLWVVLRGDFVMDTQGRAVDVEFVRAELPTGHRPKPPASQPLTLQLGMQGGVFESWFTLTR